MLLLTGPALGNGMPSQDTPLGLPLAIVPRSATEVERAEWGRELFFDKRLSADGRISCSSCHDPAYAFTDNRPRAIGVAAHIGTRNAPSLLNVGYQTALFWDGRTGSLEQQAQAPLLNPFEHGLSGTEQVVQIVRNDAGYRAHFAAVSGRPVREIAIADVVSALAAYERTLRAGDSPFDRYYYGHDLSALTPGAVHGLELFQGRGRCTQCHTIGPQDALFTDQAYHASITRLGEELSADLPALTHRVLEVKAAGNQSALDHLITEDSRIAALGRFVVSGNPADIGQFKTPSLRDVAVTGPYMHDGSVATLQEAIEAELYVRGAAANYPIVLTASEQGDLLEFLRSLTSPGMN